MSYKTKYKSRKGVPYGYKEKWKYYDEEWVEQKKKDHKGTRWDFRFKSKKIRPAKSYGSFGKGTKGIWEIKAKQYILKTGKGKYNTLMIGTKRPIKFKVKRPRY